MFPFFMSTLACQTNNSYKTADEIFISWIKVGVILEDMQS